MGEYYPWDNYDTMEKAKEVGEATDFAQPLFFTFHLMPEQFGVTDEREFRRLLSTKMQVFGDQVMDWWRWCQEKRRAAGR